MIWDHELFIVDAGDRDPRDCDDRFAPDRPIDELTPDERPARRRAEPRFAPPRPPLAHLTQSELERDLAFGKPAMRQVLARAELVRRRDAPPPTLFDDLA